MSGEKATEEEVRQLNGRISESWSANVQIRAEDLEKGTDSSYIHIIEPWVLSRVSQHAAQNGAILDIGCGCGFLTNEVYQNGNQNVVGVDLSSASIAYARSRYPAVSFVCQDICAFQSDGKFALCLAIMALNNMPDIDGFFSAVDRLLDQGGKVLLVLPHPCFWPQRHLKAEAYSYWRETSYEFQFATKGRRDYLSNVLYFHRTLETYLQCIWKHGFQIVNFQELTENPGQLGPDILGIELERKSL